MKLFGIDDDACAYKFEHSAHKKIWLNKRFLLIQGLWTGLILASVGLLCRWSKASFWVQIAIMALASFAAAAFFVWRNEKRIRKELQDILRKEGSRCIFCGYDLSKSLDSTCPECGNGR